MKNELEKSLKRFLKGKLKITLATVVVFAISGNMLLGATLIQQGKNEKGDKVKGAIEIGIKKDYTYENDENGNAVKAYNDLKATGEFSIAMGYKAEAKGNQSVAIGTETKSEASYSIAMGVGARTTGWGSVALGWDTQAFQQRWGVAQKL